MILEALRKQLASGDLDLIFDALMDAGKDGHQELRADVEPFLEHPEGELRGAAIRVLAFYWQLPEYRERADQLWREDADEEVRGAALMSWATYYRETGDPDVMQVLVDLLTDDEEVEDVRAIAWPSLLAVSGLPKSEWPDRTAVYGDIDDGVDWGLVDKLLEQIGR